MHIGHPSGFWAEQPFGWPHYVNMEWQQLAGSTQRGTRHIAAVENSAGFRERRLTGAGAYSPYRPEADHRHAV